MNTRFTRFFIYLGLAAGAIDTSNAQDLTFSKFPNTYVSIPSSQKMQLGTGSFSVEAVIRPGTDQIGYPMILSTRKDHSSGFFFSLNPSGGLAVQLEGVNYNNVQTGTFNDNTCHRVAFIKTTDSLFIYADGVQLQKLQLYTPANVSVDHPLLIGNDFESNPYNGTIKEVKIWNRRLSHDEAVSGKSLQTPGASTNLIGYYKLNEGSGQTVTDYSANPVNGTLGSSTDVESVDPVWGTTSCLIESDKNLSFDHTKEAQVLIPHKTKLNLGTGTLTFEAVIQADVSQYAYAMVLSKRSDTGDGYFLCLNSSGAPMAQFAGGNYGESYSASDLRDGKCHHIAVVRTSTQVKFYADNVLVHTQDLCCTHSASSLNPLYIGNDYGDGSNWAFNGIIKEVKIWSEVQTQFPTPASGQNLIAYYKLNEGSGQSINDAAAAPANGLLGNMDAEDNQDPQWEESTCSGVLASVFSRKHSELVSLSPNPAAEIITISYPGDFQFEIMNTKGQILQTGTGAGTAQVNVQGYEHGAYVVRIMAEEQISSSSFIVN